MATQKSKICLGPSNMFCLFNIYCSVVEASLKYYWRMLNVIMNKSPISIIYPICFQLNHGKMANAITHQRILKVKNPAEVLS
jgi:hypothetical protein